MNEVEPGRVRVAVALTTQQIDLHHMEWIEIRVAIAKPAREQWVVAAWVGRPGELLVPFTRDPASASANGVGLPDWSAVNPAGDAIE